MFITLDLKEREGEGIGGVGRDICFTDITVGTPYK